jgi:hypothetical protein
MHFSPKQLVAAENTEPLIFQFGQETGAPEIEIRRINP